MGDSVEYRDGVFVGTPATLGTAATDEPGGARASTGTALAVRPGDSLAGTAGPPVAVGLDERPAGLAPLPTRDAGRARRIAAVAVVVSLVAAGAVAVAAGAAAAGGGSGSGATTPGSSRGALAGAATRSMAARSVAFTVQASQTSGATTTTLLSGSGAVDLATDVSRVSASVPALSGIVGSGDDTVSLVTSGSAVYVGVPALAPLTGGKTWLGGTLPKDGHPGSSGQATLAILADPARLIGLLGSSAGPVTRVGPAVLGGVPTTEYRTTVSLAGLASRLDRGHALGARAAAILGRIGNTSVPVTAWVAGDGTLRQLSASILLTRATLGGLVGEVASGSANGSAATRSTAATTLTVGFSHYGEPVAVSVPPSAQVTNLGSVLSLLPRDISRFGHDLSGLAAGI